MIAIDEDEMGELRRRLTRAAADLGTASPTPPSSASFGPAVLGGAASDYAEAVRREHSALRDRWVELDRQVGGVIDDMATFEASAVDELVALRSVLE